MKLIAHRGNTHGPDEGKENNPDYIDKCLSEGYDAEIDVRYDPITTVFWLGHDEPQYKVSWKWMANRAELHGYIVKTLQPCMSSPSMNMQGISIFGMTKMIIP